MSTRGTSFNEARREAPGSPLSKVCFRVNPDMRFNEARRESPGSRLPNDDQARRANIASMRPGANRRDHPRSWSTAHDPGANRRDHLHTQPQLVPPGALFNAAAGMLQ